MKNKDSLATGNYYHIFNRAVGTDKLFLDGLDYERFIEKWKEYIDPLTDCFSFCLMPNHFHFLIRVRDRQDWPEKLKGKAWEDEKVILNRFRAHFTSHAKYFNIRHRRKGKLFMLPFRRRIVDSEGYLTKLVFYIHRNPIHHGYSSSPVNWEYSSYRETLTKDPTWIARDQVAELFGGIEQLKKDHEMMFLFNDVLHRPM